MKVYSVSPVEDCPDNEMFFAKKSAAMRAAREVAANGAEATVTCIEVANKRGAAFAASLLNRVGFSVGTEVVAVITADDV